MEITEIRIKLMEGSEDRLRAFCSITIDESFVVRDLKIIDGSSGPFVAMPSRKLTGHCNRCRAKNHLRATYCNHCGNKISSGNFPDSPQKLYADVAHPINSECREMIQAAVIDEFEAELQRASQPGYRSRYDDDFDDGDYDDADYDVEASTSDRKDSAPPAEIPVATSDNFGAGLLQDDSQQSQNAPQPAQFDSGVSPTPSIPNAGRDTEDHHDEAEVIVRGEKGDGHRVPRPHFHDRPGGQGRGEHVGAPVPDQSGHAVQSSQGNQDGADEVNRSTGGPTDDGFGAGIFDD